MNILITGSSGMLGSALCSVLSKQKHKITGLDLSKQSFTRLHSFIKCDITNYQELNKAVKKIKPNVIIHAAAFTDVDGCESDSGKAEAVNGVGTQYVAEAAYEIKAALLYLSTDFIFDGQKRSPYKENDPPNPINTYGKSKLDGEKFVIHTMKKEYFIIRSSWMFGLGGKNFVDSILKKAISQKEIKIVSDQFGSPTYTVDLADAIMRVLNLYRKKESIYGVYHITNSDDCSWYRLAQKALELARMRGIKLVPIVSEELDRPAERPMMSILDNSRYIELTGRPLRSWEKALEEYVLARGRG